MVGQIRQLATRGAMAVVLGCTEIELLVQQEHVEDVPVIYSGALHIEAAIEVQTNRRSIDEFLPPRQHLSGSPAAPQASTSRTASRSPSALNQQQLHALIESQNQRR